MILWIKSQLKDSDISVMLCEWITVIYQILPYMTEWKDVEPEEDPENVGWTMS